MAVPHLVLSCFPGIDLLGRGFDEIFGPDICIVRGPDPIWGGDIRSFTAPRGVFWGVIAGPPCGAFSPLRHMVEAVHGAASVAENLIPEFERVVSEAHPAWFIMENSRYAPAPVVDGYRVNTQVLDNRWFGEAQQRQRRISFGTQTGARLLVDVSVFESPAWESAVVSDGRRVCVKIGGSGKLKATLAEQRHRSIGEMLALQGFPPTLLDDCPLTESGKRKAIANGVPLPMARAIAAAVRRATQPVAEVG